MTKITPQGSLDLDATRTTRRAEEADHSFQTHSNATLTASREDRIEVSGNVSTIADLTLRAAAGSGIRQDRVASLRALVESGNYNPAPLDIADAILRDEV